MKKIIKILLISLFFISIIHSKEINAEPGGISVVSGLNQDDASAIKATENYDYNNTEYGGYYTAASSTSQREHWYTFTVSNSDASGFGSFYELIVNNNSNKGEIVGVRILNAQGSPALDPNNSPVIGSTVWIGKSQTFSVNKKIQKGKYYLVIDTGENYDGYIRIALGKCKDTAGDFNYNCNEVEVGEAITGEIAGLYDTDIYSFTAPLAGKYKINFINQNLTFYNNKNDASSNSDYLSVSLMDSKTNENISLSWDNKKTDEYGAGRIYYNETTKATTDIELIKGRKYYLCISAFLTDPDFEADKAYGIYNFDFAHATSTVKASSIQQEINKINNNNAKTIDDLYTIIKGPGGEVVLILLGGISINMDVDLNIFVIYDNYYATGDPNGMSDLVIKGNKTLNIDGPIPIYVESLLIQNNAKIKIKNQTDTVPDIIVRETLTIKDNALLDIKAGNAPAINYTGDIKIYGGKLNITSYDKEGEPTSNDFPLIRKNGFIGNIYIYGGEINIGSDNDAAMEADNILISGPSTKINIKNSNNNNYAMKAYNSLVIEEPLMIIDPKGAKADGYHGLYSIYKGNKTVANVQIAAQIKLLNIYNSAKGADIRFKPANGIEEYILMRKTDGVWSEVKRVKAGEVIRINDNQCQIFDESIKNNYGRGYIYSVSGKVGNYILDYDTKGLALYRLKAPTIKSIVANGNGKVTLTWSKETCHGYEIQYSSDNGTNWIKYPEIKDPNRTTITINNLDKNKTYVFRIRCQKTNPDRGVGWSQYSSWAKVNVK